MIPLESWQGWPSGCAWTIAVTGLTTAKLAETGIEFGYAEDDLGAMQVALLKDRLIGDVMLRYRDRSPLRGIEIEVDAAVSRTRGLAAAHRMLPLDSESLIWIAPNARYDGFLPSQVAPNLQKHLAKWKQLGRTPVRSSSVATSSDTLKVRRGA